MRNDVYDEGSMGRMKLSRRRIYAVSLSVVAVLALFGYLFRTQLALAGFDLFLSDRVERELERSYQPFERRPPAIDSPVRPEPVVREKHSPLTLLLLGVDARGRERGRSDTMILTVVRPWDGAMLLISIPRDTYVTVPGDPSRKGWPHQERKDKITHAYAYGGAELAVETVERFLDVRIDHYASINFQGFRDVIDEMGGIKLLVEKDLVNDDEDHEKFIVKAGQPFYNGEDALNYVRFREDAGGDRSRAGRQQIFIQAILDKATGIGQWTKIPELIGIMGDNFATDIPPDDIINLAKKMLTADTRVMYSHTLEGRGGYEGAGWYLFPIEEDVEQTKAWIRAWLDGDTPRASLPKPGSGADGVQTAEAG